MIRNPKFESIRLGVWVIELKNYKFKIKPIIIEPIVETIPN